MLVKSAGNDVNADCIRRGYIHALSDLLEAEFVDDNN
jgi:hypothetical protein